MLMLLSPAKRLDETPVPRVKRVSEPEFLDDAETIVRALRRYSAARLAKLMNVSDEIARENHQRYRTWERPFEGRSIPPAIFAFRGDVYLGLDAPTLTARDLTWTNSHLRILSGLYGMLRPLDLMHPYRLEMGTRISIARTASLHAYWKPRIIDALRAAHEDAGGRGIVNLASAEYFKAVDHRALGAPVVTPVFKERRDNGRLQSMSFFAKKARGAMARWAIDERIRTPEQLRTYADDRYEFDEEHSTETTWVFTRAYEPAGAS